jgi:2-keto-4-pentenoate hydratase/2-oxohepta-3-ene-1,7-dioic acid hydratase in catechol pathway
MRICFYNDYTLGMVKDDKVIDLSSAVSGINAPTPQDLINAVIEDFEDIYRARFEEIARTSDGVLVTSVRFRAPLPNPGKILCMGVNFLENGALKEPKPIHGFIKSSDCVIGSGDVVELPSGAVKVFQHEAELGVVVGKKARNVSASDAGSHIFGYLNFIDFSARGMHPSSMVYMKSPDTFGPMGPVIVTADEVPDPYAMQVRLWVNGELCQNHSVSDMAHKIPRCIEWLSSITTLDPGDLIPTGTNHQGLASIQDGDLLEMEIGSLGLLSVTAHDADKREWKRGPDPVLADFMAGRSDIKPFWLG